MSTERLVLIACWMVSAGALLYSVHRSNIRHVVIVFMSMQFLAWAFSLTLVELGWLRNPVREFQHATQANFTFNYIMFPSAAVLYNRMYPENKSILARLVYVLSAGLFIGLLMHTIQAFTDLSEFVKLTWYGVWALFAVSFYATRRYRIWFFRGLPGDAS